MTAVKDKFIADAKVAGYAIETHGKHLHIVKRTPKTRQIKAGICLCEDGKAFRIDVELGMALTIRTFKDMRSILNI